MEASRVSRPRVYIRQKPSLQTLDPTEIFYSSVRNISIDSANSIFLPCDILSFPRGDATTSTRLTPWVRGLYAQVIKLGDWSVNSDPMSGATVDDFTSTDLVSDLEATINIKSDAPRAPARARKRARYDNCYDIVTEPPPSIIPHRLAFDVATQLCDKINQAMTA